uniref:Uncharacterized protein n=1 Tax=Pithovirus LCPAC401 TaxID=2506595 RepID=A0A481ZAP4_9VIRU|nr:MAG: hypothetical protein LCPAC401_04850 [Pithovirus LCPAC401]
MECDKCEKIPKTDENKPFGEYFMCQCFFDGRFPGQLGPELEHWNDKMCNYCSEEQNRCRTCGEVPIEPPEITCDICICGYNLELIKALWKDEILEDVCDDCIEKYSLS